MTANRDFKINHDKNELSITTSPGDIKKQWGMSIHCMVIPEF